MKSVLTRTYRCGLVCLLLAALPGVVKADWMDGNYLYMLYLGYSNSSQGKESAEHEASGTYFGYVVGVVNATDALAKASRINNVTKYSFVLAGPCSSNHHEICPA